MSVKVYATYPPARYGLAVAVSAALLLQTLLGAAWLTHLRSQPLRLGPPRPIPAETAVTVAWPSEWQELRLSRQAGPIVAAVTEPTEHPPTRRILLLLVERLRNRFVPPATATLSLLAAVQRQLHPSGLDLRGPATMADLPAFEIQGHAMYAQHRYRMLLRTGVEPAGRAVGLMLLTSADSPAAAEHLLNTVASSIEVSISWAAPGEALGEIGLRFDGVAETLRAFVHRIPILGPVRLTFMPSTLSGSADHWAIDLWMSWRAKGLSLQDMAASYLRQELLSTKGPREGQWIKGENGNVWKILLERQEAGPADLVQWLYLKELPGRRVAWALGTWTSNSSAERVVMRLLESIKFASSSTAQYDELVERAKTVLSSLKTGLLEEYYVANVAPEQWFEYHAADGEPSAYAVRSVSIDQETFSMAESLFEPTARRPRYEASGWIRADLAAFEYAEHLRRPDVPRTKQRRLAYRKEGPDRPVEASLKFNEGPTIHYQFSTAEPFLPDPALEAAALTVARAPPSAALFRCIGAAEVPESVVLKGLGSQELNVHGRLISAFVCAVRYDTSDAPTLFMFDEHGRLMGLLWQSSASLVRTTRADIENQFTLPRR